VAWIVVLALAGWLTCGKASALIMPPTTLDGPSSAIGEFGGAAVSADGSGGLVYVKQVEGVPHVFAARFVEGHWSLPSRVDWGSPYDASFPRIAAANGGELVVVWVTQIATVGNRIQRALVSSTLDPGAASFGAPFIVDPDVGEGAGVDPALALAPTGQGLVAYRVVTNDFKTSVAQNTIPQLRPGDVLADIRLATFGGQDWSSPERVNRNPLLSMRPPTELNGPQAGIGRANQAVVAWQEPESNGTARIFARRVFGTTLGLVLPASPTSYDGAPITQDADAFALSVSDLGEAKVIARIAAGPGAPARLFANTLTNSSFPGAAKFSGATLVEAGAVLGAPSVAVGDQGEYRVAFTSGATAQLLSGAEKSQLQPEGELGQAAGSTGVGPQTALNPAGGGVTAWPASAGIALREDFTDGGAQAALVSGAVAGPVSDLAADGSDSGEAIVGFRQGAPGSYEIVGERVSAQPPQFLVEAPREWVLPRRARIGWSSAEDATGGVTYSVVIDGHVVMSGLRGSSAVPSRRLLGSGKHEVQILATDAEGQQTLSAGTTLEVDASPPVATARRARGREVTVKVRDAQSGAVKKATQILFGDGSRSHGKLLVKHRYARNGRYTILVRMRDKVGNGTVAHLRVEVR
jgi:PKD domain